MNPRHTKTAERLRTLIEEGTKVAALERLPGHGGTTPYIQDKIAVNAWLVKTDNILSTAFRETSSHYKHFVKATSAKHVENAYQVSSITGILVGSLNDLEGGYLVGQEHLIAGEIFDSVLEQAKELASSGYKDPAAVLARVAVEDCLRRLSREESLDDTQKATSMNDALYRKGRYTKPQWRRVQVWLDIGNCAAHGEFVNYTQEDVLKVIDEVGAFLAQELGS